MQRGAAKKNKHAVHFSSKSSEWETPQWLFEQLKVIYNGFDLDVCANSENSKCAQFFSKKQNGLVASWDIMRDRRANNKLIETTHCWMNPPYGREIGKWVKKAFSESTNNCLIACLLPARTDTKWFHDYIYNNRHCSVDFIAGRLKFSKSKNSAPFPSMIVVFWPHEKK